MTQPVARGQRWTQEHPCPGCAGWDRMPRGKGARCSGYMGTDGKYFHCSREELGGGLPQEAGGTYAHRVEGRCDCGTTHRDLPVPYHPSPKSNGNGNGGARVGQYKPVKEYEYEGGLLVVRAEDSDGHKVFWQRHRLPDGRIEKGAGKAPRTLYRAAEVRAAHPLAFVWLVEGEKCADALADRGMVATTTPQGAASWGLAAELAAALLTGRHVVILPDADAEGHKYADAARATLLKVCASLRVLDLPGLAEREDVYDWLERGGDPEDLVRMAEVREDLVTAGHIPIASVAALRLWASPLPPAIPTGIAGLDRIIVGLRAESFVVVNAPPGRGKSGFSIQLSRFMSVHRHVAYLSSELSERQVLARVAAQILRVPWSRLFEQGPSEAHVIAAALEGLKLHVVRITKGMVVVDILRRLADQLGAAPILTLDYLQHAARRLAIEDRRIAVGQLVDDIGTWACESRSTGLVVSSVARGFYRPDDDATAEDFLGAGKEAGEIECDASAELYLKTETPPEGGSAPAKLHISKHRFGASGQTVGLTFDGAVGLFRDDPAAALSDLEREVYRAVADGKRSQEDVRATAKAGKPRVQSAIRSLVRQGWIEGPPYRVLREMR